MLLLMAVSLYTFRAILNVLGVSDFGIYNLIAGFVTLFSLVTNALIAAMQRFFNVSLGTKNYDEYTKIFSMSINIIVLFSAFVILFGETFGLWFVSNCLNIPNDRYNSALITYQISLLTFVANVFRTPYHASIIAHEKMSFYAYISIIEGILLLALVLLLEYSSRDRLIIYSLLYLGLVVFIDVIYIVFCRKNFTECKYIFKWETDLFKKLFAFSGWGAFGQSSLIVRSQGESFLLNRFYGVMINATMGISTQVSSAINLFVSNFQTAFNPQITQTYASSAHSDCINLLYKASKYSYYLLAILTLPLLFNMNDILSLWLIKVPAYADLFINYTLMSYLLAALSGPFITLINANGKIKHYILTLSFVSILGLLASFVLLMCGFLPYSVAIVSFVVQFILFVIRLFFVCKYIKFSIKEYFIVVIKPVAIVSLLLLIVPYILSIFTNSIIDLFSFMFVDIVVSLLIVVLFGMNKSEKHLIMNYIRTKIYEKLLIGFIH